ncbi:MAG: hydantoinase/oxoprolinase family protein [Chloroflexi bacterium]|nr:hydantoinase/oxoprolinase family protein [Chloroflexota bacterium]
MSRYSIGIDVGGTFTDYLLVDEKGTAEIYKVLSTPGDMSRGTMAGLKEMADRKGIPFSDFLSHVALIVHGTTITTNMVLTGTYAKTGFVTVKGFTDYLNERRGMKRTLYTCKESPPRPIVPRYLIQTVEGRIDCEGKEFIPLNEDDIYAACEAFKKEKVEAIAVSLFFSFLNPSHELKVKEILEKEMPGTYVCVSHQVLPQVRIYERASTTVFNACVAPGLRAYVGVLTEKLQKNGFAGTLLLMQSNGGVVSPDVVVDFAVNTLLSGPAGGPKAGLFYAETQNISNIITIDMGGTSFDSCLIRNREPEITVENEVGEYRIAVPSLAIHTIGAGGGSIAEVEAGILKVGPRSAGSAPGPACYGLGGEEPTVSDANCVLGYLNPDYFLGGKMKLYPDRAQKAMQKIAKPLSLDIFEAAFGSYTVVNTNMVQGVRAASITKGFDPRGCMLVVAGGAGPLHACDIAKELEMELLLVPKASSVFCATGMLMSDLRHDYVRVCYSLLKEGHVDINFLNSLLQDMKEEGFATLKKEGIPQDRMTCTFSADLRYEGQFNETEVVLPITDGKLSVEDIPQVQQAFDAKHDALFGYSLPGVTLELICLRAKVEGHTGKPKFKEMAYLGPDASSAIKERRKVFYGKGFITVPVYDGVKIGHGNRIVGPSVIEEPTTTILITPDFQLTCDKLGSYLVYPKGASLEQVSNRLRQD